LYINLVFYINICISINDEASDFKFGKQLRFAKAHHKITPRKNNGGLGLEELPIILVPHNISSNLACDWRLPRPTIKSHAEVRLGVALS